jgi:hypothetical protein
MKIIIDTNIFFRDFMLDGTEFRTLLSELSKLGYGLCVPRIVFEETVNKFSEETKKALDNSRKIGATSINFVNFEHPISTPENAKDKYQQFLGEKLRLLGAEHIDYPAVTHKELVQRALSRKKPFRSSDTGGYRDALLWETILELARTDEIAFISDNPKDFSDESKQSLHPDLLDDIRSRELSAVTLFDSIGKFNQRKIYPVLKSLGEIQAQLLAEQYAPLSLSTFLYEKLVEFVGSKELDPVEIGLSTEFESPTISHIENVSEISNINVRQLTSGELLITCSVDTECEFDIFIFKPDYYILGDDEVIVWDNDWNEWYVAASISKQVILELKMTFSPEKNEVTSVSILGVQAIETG